ncbi:MAG TPA: LysR family transcriptional regulator [Polyangiaceae bacterium]|nr:LysR family transcriptional regulator [Polyangiaceae bacterium]
MERGRRVNQIWSWLPAFRVVAESQHLPTASKEAALSASALSRAVRLLEDHLGQQLFHRDGRNLVLQPAGRRFLEAVREAMRRVDDGLDALQGSTMAGPVRISAPGPLAAILVLPALQQLSEDHPDLVPHISSRKPDEIGAQLLDGRLDLAIVDDPQPEDGLHVHLLGKLSSGLYAAPHHPLAQKKTVTVEDMLEHAFVTPPKWLDDHFPPHIPRRKALVVDQLHVAVQACATGNVLGFIPDAVADAYRGDGALVRLPIELAAPEPLYAVHREVLNPDDRVVVLRHAIEAAVRRTSQLSRPGSVRPPNDDEDWS